MIEVLLADITTLEVDAIVNAANEQLAPGGGVCGAIYRAAGPQLERLTRGMAPCPTGHAVLTPGFDLPARFIVHAVGPVWHGGGSGEEALLRSAYEQAFEQAAAEGSIRSIAFPAISTGIYGFPMEVATPIALDAMAANEPRFDRVVACMFDAQGARVYEEALAGRRRS